MTIKVGDRIPDVPLALATPEGPVPIKSGDYFAGKRVALFAVPGAYTPTCSARHLPSYVEKAAELKGKGVDEIIGTSVNDAFVMRSAVPNLIQFICASENSPWSRITGRPCPTSRQASATPSDAVQWWVAASVIIAKSHKKSHPYGRARTRACVRGVGICRRASEPCIADDKAAPTMQRSTGHLNGGRR